MPTSRRQSVGAEISMPLRLPENVDRNVTRRCSIDRNRERRFSGEMERSMGKPLPQPILAAFNKAYEEVSKGNDSLRRSSLIRDLDEHGNFTVTCSETERGCIRMG